MYTCGVDSHHHQLPVRSHMGIAGTLLLGYLQNILFTNLPRPLRRSWVTVDASNQARKRETCIHPGTSLHTSTTRASLSRATYIPVLLRSSSFSASFGKHLYVKTQTCLSLVRSVRLPLLRPNRPRSRRPCPRRRSPRLRYAQGFVRACYDYAGLVVTAWNSLHAMCRNGIRRAHSRV
jgi:hypothetical protein